MLARNVLWLQITERFELIRLESHMMPIEENEIQNVTSIDHLKQARIPCNTGIQWNYDNITRTGSVHRDDSAINDKDIEKAPDKSAQ